MGDLMRRYWHPVAASAELATTSIKRIRLLGESLVLYRDKKQRIGLLAEACAHRGASLAQGVIEDRGLRCAAHSWLYDGQGACLDQPLEPNGGVARREATTIAYPTQELGGLIFAYLGPEPCPLLPRYNLLVWNDAIRETNGSVIPCNWLQVMENLLDPMHVEQLHGQYFADVLDRKGGSEAAEFLEHHRPPPMKRIGFDLFDQGIIERHVISDEDDVSWRVGTPSFFPTTSLLASRNRASLVFIVPLDDTHTWFLLHMAERTNRPVHQKAIPFFDVPGVDANGAFMTGTANGQDHMAVVTQGDIAARAGEHLGSSDAGIVMYREMLAGQMERIEGGRDPMNVRRNRAENVIINGPGEQSGSEGADGWSRQRQRRAARHAVAV